MEETKYYNGTKLLSMKDINGNTPEILMCCSNRTAGKTTYFSRYCMNRFKKKKEKFMLLYRYKYELDDVEQKFFKDIKTLFFPDDVMTSKDVAKGLFKVLLINGEECGYAVALNTAESIKKYSHMLSDVKRVLFDEFQSETNTYLSKEIQKFTSIHTSIARGQGEQIRSVQYIMLSNSVSIINPYFVALGISARLSRDTKFLRGDGFVLEQHYNTSAAIAQKGNAFNRAFSGESYIDYASENTYLNDSVVFIDKPKSRMTRYICTICFKNKTFGVKEYRNDGFLYCDDKPDINCPTKIALTIDDHSINYVMLKNNDLMISNFRFYFNHGAFRFKDLLCKEAIMTMLSY